MENKKPKLRIIVPIGMHGATDQYCGSCILLKNGICQLTDEELDWNKDNVQFKRNEYCQFQTINNRG